MFIFSLKNKLFNNKIIEWRFYYSLYRIAMKNIYKNQNSEMRVSYIHVYWKLGVKKDRTFLPRHPHGTWTKILGLLPSRPDPVQLKSIAWDLEIPARSNAFSRRDR